MLDWLYVGKIVNTHGIKGEVRVISESDFTDERFAEGSKLYIHNEKNKRYQPIFVQSYRRHKQFDLLTFQGYPTINDVEPLKGCKLFISTEQLSDLEEDAFYYHEIIGCTVVSEEGTVLGEIKEILSPGANDVWVVKTKGKDILLPYIGDVVKEVNIENKQVIVHLLPGLIDDES
ncbi:ribosome maturation factor RimM [Terrilactibacillus sp. BCM23-1]|uniref:Ribosome maturation factor RimM n=1 Tax=Terrilactibacillus tamarindi TaxID=2599694 RepID=A0A6N8CRM7_9BACI|nr:ribosome maturation factor RimM [Terrilactibacillus tamarindi]MTT32298.1 ribosome maturation factor RimM [Terrilactibacillus tamarindi]